MIVVATLSADTAEAIAPPEVILRGLAAPDEDDELLVEQARLAVDRVLAECQEHRTTEIAPRPAAAARRAGRDGLAADREAPDGVPGRRRGCEQELEHRLAAFAARGSLPATRPAYRSALTIANGRRWSRRTARPCRHALDAGIPGQIGRSTSRSRRCASSRWQRRPASTSPRRSSGTCRGFATARRAAITIHHLLTHTGGTADRQPSPAAHARLRVALHRRHRAVLASPANDVVFEHRLLHARPGDRGGHRQQRRPTRSRTRAAPARDAAGTWRASPGTCARVPARRPTTRHGVELRSPAVHRVRVGRRVGRGDRRGDDCPRAPAARRGGRRRRRHARRSRRWWSAPSPTRRGCPTATASGVEVAAGTRPARALRRDGGPPRDDDRRRRPRSGGVRAGQRARRGQRRSPSTRWRSCGPTTTGWRCPSRRWRAREAARAGRRGGRSLRGVLPQPQPVDARRSGWCGSTEPSRAG